MAAGKPTVPKGTRDFLPLEMARRNHIFDTIRAVFHLYGYQPIETPALEQLDTLLGKYGEEGDRLLFRVLNSGDYLRGIPPHEFTPANLAPLSAKLCEKGLRYDLTVPFARFVVQHQGELQFPFKRYQIQPVWRADRPQRGRYREFYQCDADVIGSTSLLNEVELLLMANEVFRRLGVEVTLKLNHRKILSGIAQVVGEEERLADITVAIDKLDKIGVEGVIQELGQKGVSPAAIEALKPLFFLSGGNSGRLAALRALLAHSAVGLEGVDELERVLQHVAPLPDFTAQVEVDPSLARGLNYYTGAIVEVKARHVPMGSIGGGGRYDNLTAIFGLDGLSGVGISFGADRIYDVMLHLGLFPPTLGAASQVMLANFGPGEAQHGLALAHQLRAHGVSAELYPDPAKIKKQFELANRKGVRLMVMAGENEIRAGVVSIKDMATGAQEQIPEGQAVDYIKGVLQRPHPQG